jgi:hypothetical protein
VTILLLEKGSQSRKQKHQLPKGLLRQRIGESKKSGKLQGVSCKLKKDYVDNVVFLVYNTTQEHYCSRQIKNNDTMGTMTPLEPVTEGQIRKLNQNISARLLKNKEELPSDIFQQVLGDDTLIDEIYASIRKRVDLRSNFIILTVKVNRNRSPKEALIATGRNLHVTDSVFENMPKAESDEVEVIFFKIGRQISDNDLDKEYELRGLKPADPYSLAAVNKANPVFADEYQNGTHWKDVGDKWCFAAFARWGDEYRVVVRHSDGGWGGSWWFAGVRKKKAKV